MSDNKKNHNPFIRMAQEAKEIQHGNVPGNTNKPMINTKVPKPTKGFGNKIIKKTGRA